MTKPNFTDITVVLDRSGSMHSLVDDVIGGFDKFIEDQKQIEGEANLTLVQFDHKYEFVYNNVPINKVGKLEYHPRGTTALLDAVGRAINETGERLSKLKEEERPSKVVFVIITDGLENSSREFKKNQIKNMIEEQTNRWQWEFIYLGANQNAFNEAQDIGINVNNAVNFGANSSGCAAAFTAYSGAVSNARRGRRSSDGSYYNWEDKVACEVSVSENS